MKKWEALIEKLDNEQSDMVIGMIKDSINVKHDKEESAFVDNAKSNAGQKNGTEPIADPNTGGESNVKMKNPDESNKDQKNCPVALNNVGKTPEKLF